MSEIYILGAPDPEMAAIEALVRAAGHVVAYATVDGRRVLPGNAYQACLPNAALEALYEDAATVILVECVDGDDLSPRDRVIRIDHHRPGDPGYGLPPSDFLRGSSLGQIVARLAQQGALPDDWHRTRSENFPICRPGQIGAGSFSDAGLWAVGLPDDPPVIGEDVGGHPVSAGWLKAVIPEQVIIMAAADHCLGSAYKGECPGVDPEALLAWRMVSRAAFQGRAVAEVEAETAAARQALRAAPMLLVPKYPGVAVEAGALWLQIDWQAISRIDYGIRDLRGPVIPELPEAAVREGVCFVATMPPTAREPRTKIVCMSGTPEQIQAFQRWAAAEGLTGIYGDPARGFAGGYLPETVVA
jgi:hypothetical protein